MTSTNPTPTLVPGIAAVRWQRAFSICFYFSIPAYVLLIIGRLFASENSSYPAWVIPVAASYIGLLVVGLVVVAGGFRRSTKRETRAAYTTTFRSRPTLPQLDAATGDVIREAGEPYVKRSEWVKRPDARLGVNTDVLTRDATHNIKPGWWSGVGSLVRSFVITVFGFGVLFGSIAGPPSNRIPRIFIWALALAVVYALIIAMCALVVRARLRRMAEAAPGNFTFVFAKSKDYGVGVVALTGNPLNESGYVVRGGSANAAGLTIWHGNLPAQAGHMAWSRVTSVQVDDVPGNNAYPARLALITFRDEFDDLATLPLAFPKVDSFPIPSKAEVRWIIDQLNELREGKTQPTLI